MVERNMKLIEKPWGSEEIIETNKFYTVKKLIMKKGHACSLQYHQKKKETIISLSDNLHIKIDGENIILNQYDTITIEPNIIHRMLAIENDVYYLECSTSELDDVVRINDLYGRQ